MKNVLLAILSVMSVAGCMSDPVGPERGQDQGDGDLAAVGETSQDLTVYYQVKNYAYSQCANAPGGVLNVTLNLAGCSGNTDQHWSFVAAGPANTYYLVNQTSGYCMEVNNGTSTPGERVDEYFCNGSTAEQWELLTRVIGGVTYNQFRHYGTNQCLDTVGGSGSNLMQYTCDPNNNFQTWRVL